MSSTSHGKVRRSVRGVLTLVVAAMLVLTVGFGCAPSQEAEQEEPPAAESGESVEPEPEAEEAEAGDQTLVFVNNLDPTTLDPHISNDAQSNIFTINMYEPLLRYEAGSTELEPCLAERFEVSDDGLEFTFHLRKGVKFHDGTVMDAEAVVYSFERMKGVGMGLAYVLDPMEKIEAVDDHTVKITLSEPYVPFLQTLPSVFVVSPESFKQNEKEGDWGREWAYNHVAGTGPYTLSFWERGRRLQIEKFEDYWRGWDGKHIERVVLVVADEPGTRRLMLEAGDVDMQIKLEDQVDDIAPLRAKEGIVVEQYPTLSATYISLACHRPPFDDVRVRKAVSYAFDYDAHNEIAYAGYAQQAQGILPRSMKYHDDDLFMYSRDPEKAKQLLEEAGYPDGFEVEFCYVGSSGVQRRTAEILQSSLGEVGIRVKPSPMTWPTLLAKFQDPKVSPDMHNINMHAAYPDPDYTLSRWVHTDAQRQGGFNGGYYSNPRVDELIEKGAVTYDDDERRAMYEEVQQILVEDAPLIWNANPMYIVAMRDYVKNFSYVPAFSRTLGYIYDMYMEGK